MSKKPKPIPPEAAPLLLDALIDAAGHLEYCGYGDSWERQAMKELRPKIDAALKAAGHKGVDVL